MKRSRVRAAGKSRNGKSRKEARTTAVPRFDSQAFLASTGTGRSTVKYGVKETVFQQGAVAAAVYYIHKGKIQLTVLSEHGREAIIAQLGPGEFFGEGCLAGQALCMTSAVATAETTVARIETDAMLRVLQEQPQFSGTFIAFLLSRNIQIEADLVDQLFNSSERRLARLLLLLANFGKEGKMETVIPRVSQEVLAARVGTTRARINFFMNKFRRLGFIEYDGAIPAGGNGLKVHTSLLNIILHD